MCSVAAPELIMALLCYEHAGCAAPQGSSWASCLSKLPSVIEGTNVAVTSMQQELTSTKTAKRGPYVKLHNKTRAKISKYANESGDVVAARQFSNGYIFGQSGKGKNLTAENMPLYSETQGCKKF